MSVELLQQRLTNGEPVISDGSFGELARIRGVNTIAPLWATHALLDPEGQIIATGIHDEYFSAGADIVTTGTFRAQADTFALHTTLHGPMEFEGLEDPGDLSAAAIRTAGQLARRARSRASRGLRLVAGSVGPLRDCYTPGQTPEEIELREGHAAYIADLIASGVDILAIETIPTIREGIAAAREAENARIPYTLSFWGENGGIGHDESFHDAVAQLEHAGLTPLALGANCIGLNVADRSLENLRYASDLPIAISANGDGDPVAHNNWEYGGEHDQHYQDAAARWIDAGAVLIGGCCGTTPSTIRGISELISPRTVF